MKKQAFTLAEVLITLGILGIVAALTLPSMMRLSQEATIGSQLAKIQTAVEEATGRVILDNPYKPLKNVTNFEEKLAKHLVMTEAPSGGYNLKDGIHISFKSSSATNLPTAAGEGYKEINVDLNGDKKPNVEGVDKFTFILSSEGLMIAQGCAAEIQSNNWKVPKDYNISTCPSYTTGNNIIE